MRVRLLQSWESHEAGEILNVAWLVARKLIRLGLATTKLNPPSSPSWRRPHTIVYRGKLVHK